MKWLTLALFISAFATFIWAMPRLFRMPSPAPMGLRVIRYTGAPLLLLHLWGLASAAHTQIGAWVAGCALYAVALGLFWWAVKAHAGLHPHAVYSSAAPVQFVSGGPYRFIRHPFYAAYLLAWMAGGIATWQAVLFVAPAIMGVLYWVAARNEEQTFLRSPHSDVYSQYMRKTTRFIPFGF